ncbi:MerR family transcriptional regulator [Halopseudomonas xiamenensis]|uniref:MerR family transcriptional regulator n=1 Tax=Halopseudomonas xiamenensis TaxID=157792 RepID=UPI00162AF04A|nr:MerR family transcriptional regulator [Halopseudomonas xiamenensis]
MTKRAELLPPVTRQAHPEEGLLPIGEVVRLTGINPVTLRAWERRYGLIRPVRTEGGHRLYSAADVDTVRRIMSWTDRGVAVSKVASLLALQTSSSAGPVADETPAVHSEPASPWGEWREGIRQAIEVFDEARLDQLYGQLFSTYPIEQSFGKVLMPLWQEWLHLTGFGQRSQWLFYDAFLRARALQRLQFLRHNGGDSVLFVVLPDSCRELEMLVTGLLLDNGKGILRTLPVGQPLDELPLVCQSILPTALVLFAPTPLSPTQLSKITKLAQKVDSPVALAGVGAELAAEQLRSSPLANLGKEPQVMASRLEQFLSGHLDT